MLILRFHDDILEAPPTSALPFGNGPDEHTFLDTHECVPLPLYPTGTMPSILTNGDFSIREVCRPRRQLTGLVRLLKRRKGHTESSAQPTSQDAR